MLVSLSGGEANVLAAAYTEWRRGTDNRPSAESLKNELWCIYPCLHRGNWRSGSDVIYRQALYRTNLPRYGVNAIEI